jgi:hypothetical protein
LDDEERCVFYGNEAIPVRNKMSEVVARVRNNSKLVFNIIEEQSLLGFWVLH